MIILDMINKASVRLAISAFHLENNIIILDIDPGGYYIENKIITAVFNPSGVETDPLVVVDNVIKLPILSHRINNGNNSIQLNFRWDTDKKEQSGLIQWKINKSLIPAATDQEDIDIISYLISEVNRVVDETGDIKSALDESITNANTINDVLTDEVTGTIRVATDTGIDLEDTIEDANYVKGLVEATIGNSETAKIALDGSIGAAGTAQTNLNNKIGEATTSKEVLDQAIVNNQIVTLPVFNAHKLDYVELETIVNNKDKVITDVTYNATFISGDWTVDSATDVLTCSVAHGLVVDDSVSFVVGTGVLPTGISPEPEFYYVCAVPTTTTLQISLTRSGTSINITANGLIGWQIRKARVSNSSINLNFTKYNEIDIYSNLEFVPIATSYLILDIRPSTTKILLNNAQVNGISNTALLYDSLWSKKYVKLPTHINIRKLDNNLYLIQVDIVGIQSDSINMASPTFITRIFSGLITGDNPTSINLREAYTSGVKNGTRFVVVRR